MKNCLENELYGKYIPQTRDVAGNESWSCLKVRDFEKETEGLITAAQDQALRTNVIKAKIEEENVSTVQEEIPRRLSNTQCVVVARSHNGITKRKRYDTLARVVHWELCKVYDLPPASGANIFLRGVLRMKLLIKSW